MSTPRDHSTTLRKPRCAQLGGQRRGCRHHRLARLVKPAQHSPDPGLRNRRSRRDVVRKAGVKARRERQAALAAIAPRPTARSDLRSRCGCCPALRPRSVGDLRRMRQGQPQIRIARHREGSERLRREEADLHPKASRRLRHHGQRPHHPVDLGMPRIGRDQDVRHAARAATRASGAERRTGSVQVMISKRPSSCSASAVQLSTQSPQFM